MPTVLSTKILTESQQELFLNTGLGLVHYNAINIQLLDFSIKDDFDYFIFTSKNALKSYTINKNYHNTNKNNAFCVGEKTKMLLENNGFTVVESAENAEKLAEIIVADYPKDSFLHLTGNLRSAILPNILKKNDIRYTDVLTYKTSLVKKRFERKFEGILFFSPSGVKSFYTENFHQKNIVFCIGNSTALEAKKYTDKIIIASKPTIENVLVQAIKYFKKHD